MVLGVMNTLKSNAEDFEIGKVTESGFAALWDAETYDQVSSVSACAANLKKIHDCVKNNRMLALYRPNESPLVTKDYKFFKEWAIRYFPASYQYMIDYKNKDI